MNLSSLQTYQNIQNPRIISPFDDGVLEFMKIKKVVFM